ncbi:MAG: cytochrome b N-terminal domain-containing protein [Desulfobacterales bacterium]
MKKSEGNQTDTLSEMLALGDMMARVKALRVPADALTWHRFSGSLLLVLLVLLFLSGAFMAFYYSPAPGAAYDSVDYALYSVPFGDVIKGVHHYGWNIFLIVLGLHLVRAFIVGAYKSPRQLMWVSGVLTLLLIPALIVTGDLLPWDQNGFWTTQVRISIIASVPVVGDFLVRLIQGGPLTGIVALTRFYVLHILFLPALLIILIVIHFHFLKVQGLSEPLFKKNSQSKTISFFPQLVNRWLLLFLGVTLVLGVISWYWPAPLGDPADPTDSTFVPRPEWWVLFLNQLVTIFKGSLTVIGSVIIPGGLMVLLLVLPFLDTSLDRHPARRKIVLLVAVVVVIILLGLSIMGYVEHSSENHS